MIDPLKPMYDADGREWVALRMPDGDTYRHPTGYFLAVSLGEFFICDNEGKFMSRHDQLSNTKPQKDWEVSMRAWAPVGATRQLVDIRAGYRNGKAFAEVVE